MVLSCFLKWNIGNNGVQLPFLSVCKGTDMKPLKPKKFQIERARKAWPILTECACNQSRQPMTYGQLAERMRIHHRVCGFFLGLIQECCMNHRPKLPPLQSLVVNKHTRVPGDGYIATPRDRHSIEQAQNSVFDFHWNQIENPF